MSIKSYYENFDTTHRAKQELSNNIEKLIKEKADRIKRGNDMCDSLNLETFRENGKNEFESFINGCEIIKSPNKPQYFYDPVKEEFFPPFELPNQQWIYSGSYRYKWIGQYNKYNKYITIIYLLDNYMNIYFPDRKCYVLYNHSALSFSAIFSTKAIDNFCKLWTSGFEEYFENRYNVFKDQNEISYQEIGLVLSYIWKQKVKGLCDEVVSANQFASTLYDNHIQSIQSAYIAGVRSVNEDRIKDAQNDTDYFVSTLTTDEETEKRFMDRIANIKNDLKNFDSVKENENLKKELEGIKASIRIILDQ